MWMRYTERARRAVFFAQEEAGRFGHNYVSTEHLLLGLVRENDSVAARLLDRMGVSLGRVRSELEKQMERGEKRLGQEVNLTPRAKRVIDLAYSEARRLDDAHIGTEHLLLGLVREGDGIAGMLLAKLGVTLRKVRRQVLFLNEDGKRAKEGREPLTNKERDTWAAEAYERVYGNDEAPERDAPETTNPPRSAPPENKVALSVFERVRYALKFLRRTEPELFQAQEPDTTFTERVAEIVDETTLPQPGDLGRAFASASGGMVEMAKNADVFQSLCAAYQTKDAHGYRELTQDGDALLFIPDGTPLKMLKPVNGDAAKSDAKGMYVRILGGSYEGRAGWMVAEAFRREGPDNAAFPPQNGEDSL